MKNFSPIRLALAIATVFSALTLGGCELYFGGHDGGDDGGHWTYCAQDGYYTCQGDNCEWAGPRCPSDPNYTCTTNADCAQGCYCANGVCEEAGFCGKDGTCPDGFHCDQDRSSCEPNTCTSSADCQKGEYCDPATSSCTASCTCTTDAQAQAQGFGYCDETRGTCEPASQDGSCGGTVTCNQIPTACPEGQVAMIKDNCWTGTCRNISMCDLAPVCNNIQHEDDCLGRSADCTTVYTGIDCTAPDGSSCVAGSMNCTCVSFEYNSCRPRTSQAPAMSFLTDDGHTGDVFSLLAH